MSDEFLYRAAPAVRAEFADDLYERLSRTQQSKLRGLGWIGLNRRTLKNSLALVALTAIAVACARELFRQRYVQVGEMWLLEVAPVRTARIELARPVNASSQPPERISVTDALEMLPYALRLPAWVPTGYSLAAPEAPPPGHPGWIMNLNWSNERDDHFFLFACVCELEIQAPPGTWSETRVNSTPAILIRGRFPPYPHPLPTPATYQGTKLDFVELETRWDEDAGLTLVWEQDGARLNLWTFGDHLSEGDVVRIAESMGTP